MIRFNDIKKKFKSDFWDKPFWALKGVTFSIEEGTLVGFLGANGAGKTTLMKVLMGFIKADGGDISFDSKILGHTNKEVISNIGYLPERPYFYPHLSGHEFLMYMGRLNGIDKKILRERISHWAKHFSIHFALNRKIRDYSKGMLQRLGFVSTLLHNPKMLVLDEPLSGLDPVGRKELKDAIVDLSNQGKTVFFSSHIVSDIEEICSDVVVLEKGLLFYHGKTDDLIRQHTDQTYELIYSSDNNNSLKERVEASTKDNRILELIEDQNKILSVNICKPTLEDIIYRSKYER